MAKTKLQQFIVYLPPDLARFIRAAAAAHGGNVSAYLRALAEREADPDAVKQNGERRILEYLLTIGLHQLKIAGPNHLKDAQSIHTQRMAQGKSYAD